jgi:hypothetical protein
MARDPLDQSRIERLDAALREMFETLSAQPVPSRLLSLVEQLDDEPETDQPKPSKSRAGRRPDRGGQTS